MKICILIKKYLFPAQGGVLALTSEIISDENVITTLGNQETRLCTFNSPSVCSYRLDTLKVFNTHTCKQNILCYHLRDDQLIISTWRWSASPRGKGCGGLWSVNPVLTNSEGPWGQKASTAHEDASRPVWGDLHTSEWLCSFPTLPSGKARNTYTISPRNCKDHIRKELDDTIVSFGFVSQLCKDTIWQQSGSSNHGWEDRKQLLAQLQPSLTTFPFSPNKYLFRGRSVIKPLQGKRCIQ